MPAHTTIPNIDTNTCAAAATSRYIHPYPRPAHTTRGHVHPNTRPAYTTIPHIHTNTCATHTTRSDVHIHAWARLCHTSALGCIDYLVIPTSLVFVDDNCTAAVDY
jgi:hypothetical protein